uniref:Uncharacterized protein n=1 Tax=Cacopsylla melanoneura TaxID=428564 RepID=A0A8D8ZD69_9HEMI
MVSSVVVVSRRELSSPRRLGQDMSKIKLVGVGALVLGDTSFGIRKLLFLDKSILASALDRFLQKHNFPDGLRCRPCLVYKLRERKKLHSKYRYLYTLQRFKICKFVAKMLELKLLS